VSEPVTLRFYAELNDHVSGDREVECVVEADAEVGVLIERCGVPLSEVELIVVEGESVGPEHRVRSGARVGVYPVFESFDITPEARLRARPLRVTRFLVEGHLAPLGELLRCHGYDVLESDEPVDQRRSEGRIVLTTAPEVIGDETLTHCLLVAAGDPDDQLGEVARRLHLDLVDPPG
jgi:hypothetical protein